MRVVVSTIVLVGLIVAVGCGVSVGIGVAVGNGVLVAVGITVGIGVCVGNGVGVTVGGALAVKINDAASACAVATMAVALNSAGPGDCAITLELAHKNTMTTIIRQGFTWILNRLLTGY